MKLDEMDPDEYYDHLTGRSEREFAMARIRDRARKRADFLHGLANGCKALVIAFLFILFLVHVVAPVLQGLNSAGISVGSPDPRW